ncbi:hypothetical protein ACHQM5_017759 [Ranunculus cassubicifolius]
MEGDKDDAAPNKKVVKKNFMWSARKHMFVVAYLAERARSGEKKGRSFGKPILTKAARAVFDEFKEECRVENVESWLKTAKKKYTRIMELRDKKSGWSWNDADKIIKVDRDIAAEFIEENAYAKDLLNVPLLDFEYLRLVCGEDLATGSYAKSNSDGQSENVAEEATSEAQDVVGPSTTNHPNDNPRKRTRQYFMEEAVQTVSGLTKEITRLTNAIGSDQEFCNRVFDEVMTMVEFDDFVLNKAFEHLTENPLVGRQFVARRHEMRVVWLKEFASNLS